MRRYTARLAEGGSIAENVAYGELVTRVLQAIIEAALAKASDRFSWEQEQLRRNGLRAIEFARDGRALWSDREVFDAEEAGAARGRVRGRFAAENEMDGNFLKKLDYDLRQRLQRAGYATGPVTANMRKVFEQIACEAEERSARAQRQLLDEIVGPS